MRFTVVWDQAALDQLADIWNRSPHRSAVTAAQNLSDQFLRIDPDTRGVPFFGDRLLFIPPLRLDSRSIEWT